MNRPWFQMFSRDWLDNKELRRCSPLARSILADLMCLAHEGNPYGYLCDDSGPMTEMFMASRCVLKLRDFRRGFEELRSHSRIVCSSSGVLSGVFLVPRMVRDEEIRLRRASGGKESIGSPNTCPPKSLEGYPSDHPSTHPSFEIDSRARGCADSDSDSGSSSEVKLTTEQKTVSRAETPAENTLGPVLVQSAPPMEFMVFHEAADAALLSASESDWKNSREEWSKMDFPSKIAAVKGLKDRVVSGEYGAPSRYLPLPQNYLKNKIWQRDIRAPVASAEQINGVQKMMAKGKALGIL